MGFGISNDHQDEVVMLAEDSRFPFDQARVQTCFKYLKRRTLGGLRAVRPVVVACCPSEGRDMSVMARSGPE